MNTEAVKSIIENLDAERLTKSLGVGHRSLRLAKERGVFPASWFPTVSQFCAAQGIDCPMDAFNWKTRVDPQSDPRCHPS